MSCLAQTSHPMSDTPQETPDSPKPMPSPEEITRKLEDFIKNSLGGQVVFSRIEPHNLGTKTPELEEGDSEPQAEEVGDLMEALRKSLGQGGARRPAEPAPRRAAAKTPAARKTSPRKRA